MKLWDAEVEGLRDEARQKVQEYMPLVLEALGRSGSHPGDRDERVRRSREQYDQWIQVSDEGVNRKIAGVPCRVFTPKGPASAVYLHFHGGGMIIGKPEMNDLASVELCKRHNLAVVSVDYRLAPEHPFPAGPDDGIVVAAWLLEHAEAEFGSGRMLIGGESAGGYMTAAVALRVRDELGAIDRVLGLNVIFGVLDWGSGPSQRGARPSDGPDILDPDSVAFFSDCYLPGMTNDERRDPAISPAFADLRGMPPAFISVGTADHLLDDSLIYAMRYAVAGNDVELFVAPDMPHAFMAIPCDMTKLWAARNDDWIAARLGAGA